MIFLEADLSQVEARIQLMLAAGVPEVAGTNQAKECIRLATAHPAEFDIHKWVAAVALDKSEADISDVAPTTGAEPSERHVGKFTGYGFFRGMGPQTMSDQLLKAGYIVTPETCERRLSRVAARLPAITEGFFPDIRRQLMRYRGLGNTWGRIWRCDYQRFEEHLYGEGYSFQPVSEAVDLINQCGFLPLWNALRMRQICAVANGGVGAVRGGPRLNVHGHDSLLISCSPDDAWRVAKFLDKTLAQATRVYAAGALTVPVTWKLGENWKGTHEWKRLPSEREFRDAAHDCEQRRGQ